MRYFVSFTRATHSKPGSTRSSGSTAILRTFLWSQASSIVAVCAVALRIGESDDGKQGQDYENSVVKMAGQLKSL